MENFRKIFFPILINICVFVLIWFISDLCIYAYNGLSYTRDHGTDYTRPPFKYLTEVDYGFNPEFYFNGEDNVFRGRKPEGLEYKDAEPIVIFGCSYAHGQHLEYNETFGYKLAHLLKRPVYNRAIPGRGLQHMYMQATSEEFYRNVPPTDDFIYVFIGDHYRRFMVNFIDLFDIHFNGHYSVKNGRLVLDNDKNVLLNIFKSSYTFKLINQQYVRMYVNNPKNADKLTDVALLYFVKTRESLESRLGQKINFTVFIYDNYPFLYKELMVKKLKENGFNVIKLEELSDEDFNSPKYLMKENRHPSAEAWTLLTPKIAERLPK